ncbi:MAG: SGNH/GDSL hydrolase family protein, partial [Bdellovibrionales bacterium]
FSCAQAFGEVGILGPHGMHGNKLSNPDRWMAIVGDSGVTGAASSVNIEPTVSSLIGHLASFVTQTRVQTELPLLAEFPNPGHFHLEKIEPLTRVPYSRAEFKASGNVVNRLLLNLGAKFSLKLDVHEHSFGYLVGKSLGIQPQDIVLVGQDGVMVKTLGDQFGRIFEMQTKTLPPLVLVSFTANDLCDAHVFDYSPAEWAGDFKQALERSWRDAKPYLKAHPRGTHIVVLAPFDVVNVITNPEILAQKTNVEGQGEITCGQLRHGETNLTVSSWLIMRMLNLMCPSVTKTHPDDLAHLEHLRNVQLAFGEAWKSVIASLNVEYAERGIRWTFLDSIRDLHFTTGDVGNDCFHPSVRGHAKLADLILQNQVLE